MTARMTKKDYAELKARGYLDNATITGGNGDEAKKWSNATPTTIRGVKCRSKCEARVYLRLIEMYGMDNIRRDIRMPLLAGDKGQGKVLYQTIDFVLVKDGKSELWVDAKTNRKSRDWGRGIAMFRQTWGEVHEWNGIGDPPWENNG